MKLCSLILQTAQVISTPEICTYHKLLYALNGVKPDNVLVTQRKEQHLAILVDFKSARPAIRAIKSHTKALELQVPLHSNLQMKIIDII